MNSDNSPRPVGNDAEGVFHEETWDQTRGPAVQLRNSPNCSVVKTPRGIFLKVKAPKGGGGASFSILDLYFVKMFGEYFIARDSNFKYYAVARPPEHRNSVTHQYIAEDGRLWDISYPNNALGNPLAFISRTKTARGEDYSENQRISPPYEAPYAPLGLLGSSVRAWKRSTPSGIVTVGPENGDIYTTAGSPVMYEEFNTSGRAWATNSDPTSV